MSTLAIELNPLAEGVEFTDDEFIVSLADGRRVSVPLIRHKRIWQFETTGRECLEQSWARRGCVIFDGISAAM